MTENAGQAAAQAQTAAGGSSQPGPAPTAAAGGHVSGDEVATLRSSVEKLTRVNQEISSERTALKVELARLNSVSEQATVYAQAIVSRAQAAAASLPEQVRSTIPQGLSPIDQLNLTEALAAAFAAAPQQPAQAAPQAAQPAQQQQQAQPFAPPLPPVSGQPATTFEERFARFSAASPAEQLKLLETWPQSERSKLARLVRPVG
jgi:hypothetical protein